jgi:hypothetical protein
MIIPAVIDDSLIESTLNSIARILDIAIENKGNNSEDFESIDEKYSFLMENYSTIKGHCYDLLSYLPGLHKIAINEMDLSYVEKILEVEQGQYLVDQPQFRIDDPSNSRMTAMHQEGYGLNIIRFSECLGAFS